MARRSLLGLLRRKRAERRHMSLEMRNLMESFEAQYDKPKPKPRSENASDAGSSTRASQDSR